VYWEREKANLWVSRVRGERTLPQDLQEILEFWNNSDDVYEKQSQQGGGEEDD
jgi:hypothetical protein